MITNTELYHYGIPKRSGRYPYGSGDRPYQDRGAARAERRKAKAEAKKKKNIEIGTKRLSNRIDRANQMADVDRLSKKLGWENTVKAGEAHKRTKDLKNAAKEIMEDERRVESLGRYTKNTRRGIFAATLTGMAGVGGIGSAYLLSVGTAPLLALPIAGAAGIYMIGNEWMKKSYY